jgi:hypothetical protein
MESARERLSQRRLCTEQLRENEGREGGKREDRAEQRRDNRLHGADHLVVVVGQSRTRYGVGSFLQAKLVPEEAESADCLIWRER